VLKLRGDYLAIVTLGFGEIVRIFMLNLDRPVNITNGPKGISNIDAVSGVRPRHEPAPGRCRSATGATPSSRSRCTTT
jgi:ABC-type branched-subunit amino acid transport system permease subunit